MREIIRGSKELKLDFLDFIIIGDMEMNEKKKEYWSIFEEAYNDGEYGVGVSW